MIDPLPLDQQYPPLYGSLINPPLKPCSDPDLAGDIYREKQYEARLLAAERQRDGL